MNDDYLWNRSGEPDEEVVRLERLLAPLRHREKPKPRRAVWWLAAAAALVVGLLSVPSSRTSWQLESGQSLRAGEWVDSGKIEADETGELQIDAGSRVRLEEQERFRLERGTIHAFIWAKPGRFVVDTPAVKTVDLGCRYTLQVGADGASTLEVEFGWVAFESKGVESFIPEGAASVTRPGRGPGTPYYTDAPAELRLALNVFDTTADQSALRRVLTAARPRDALTLWHLLTRTSAGERGEVYDRLAEFIPMPAREAILRGDPAAVDAAWNALNLGGTDWWREWKRPW